MAEQERHRAEQQGDGQPENIRELEDDAGGAALSGAAHDDAGDAGERAEGLMGGTSDAGSAADDAAESAALERGLPGDRTRPQR